MFLHLAPRDDAALGDLKAPPGQTLDFSTRHSNIKDYNVACQVLSYALVGLCMLARIYNRAFIKPRFHFEDYTCILSWVFASILSGIALARKQSTCSTVHWLLRNLSHFLPSKTTISMTHSLSLISWSSIPFGPTITLPLANSHHGRAHGLVPPKEAEILLKLQYFGLIAYYLAAFFTKVSILCFITRVLNPHRKAVLSARILIGLMALYYLIVIPIRVFRCNPIRKIWVPRVEGRCIASERSMFLLDCVVSLLTDIAIFGLPVPLVWKLQTSLKHKVRILLVFASGIAACAAIITRFILFLTFDEADFLYFTMVISLLVIAEANIGIICSCLPSLQTCNQHVVGLARNLMLDSSPYHELGALSRRRTTDVERVRIDGLALRQQKSLGGDVALHQQYLGPKAVAQSSALCTADEAQDQAGNDGSWDGAGILKTVSLETWTSPAAIPEATPPNPPKALLHTSFPRTFGN